MMSHKCNPFCCYNSLNVCRGTLFQLYCTRIRHLLFITTFCKLLTNPPANLHLTIHKKRLGDNWALKLVISNLLLSQMRDFPAHDHRLWAAGWFTGGFKTVGKTTPVLPGGYSLMMLKEAHNQQNGEDPGACELSTHTLGAFQHGHIWKAEHCDVTAQTKTCTHTEDGVQKPISTTNFLGTWDLRQSKLNLFRIHFKSITETTSKK